MKARPRAFNLIILMVSFYLISKCITFLECSPILAIANKYNRGWKLYILLHSSKKFAVLLLCSGLVFTSPLPTTKNTSSCDLHITGACLNGCTLPKRHPFFSTEDSKLNHRTRTRKRSGIGTISASAKPHFLIAGVNENQARKAYTIQNNHV